MLNIKGTVKGYIYDCCDKYAKKKGISIDDIQLILSLDVDLGSNNKLSV